MTKKIISILALAFAIATPALNVNTQAQTAIPNYRVVTATNGLNVRDKNCNRVDTIGYGTLVSEESKSTITCIINGKSVRMINYRTVFGNFTEPYTYVAEAFTKTVISKSLDFSSRYPNVDVSKPETIPNFQVDASNGLNLRDENCKKITAVRTGTILKSVVGGGSVAVCKAGNEFYEMTNIIYNGKSYLVATNFLKVI